MNKLVVVLGCLSLVCGPLHSQAHTTPSEAKPVKVHAASFFEIDKLPLTQLIPSPPANGSETEKAEFAELHHIQASRTPEQIKAAQADEAEQDIFVYRTVLGASFNAQDLPLTAALSAKVHGDEPVAGDPLKDLYQRPRPYQLDATLHPVCKLTEKHNSFPSGHALSGYLLALTLTQIVPEKSTAILARADEYAHNRLICGVHTTSDLEASRRIAYAMFGSMLQQPKFQQELAAARTETRHALGLTQ